jgi:hypothetical protein
MPSRELVQRALNSIKRAADYEYFFSQLKSRGWIKPLWDAGLFRSPPELIREGQYVRFPMWPESQYLARMAARAPDTVLDVLIEMPDTENVRVHEDFADASLAMPAALAAKWVKKETRWIEQQQNLYFLLPQKLGALITHLCKGGQVGVALQLTRILLTILPDNRGTDAKDQYETSRLSPEPQARFDRWHYKQILQKNIPDLIAAAGEQALTLLFDLLESAIDLSRRREDDEGPEDYSYIWRPVIEDHGQNRPYSLKELLVTTVRDAAEQLARAHPTLVPTLVQTLESRRRHIFHRIALHLLRIFPETAPDIIAARLTDRTRFDELGLRHEYALLVRDRFAHLSADDQSKILDWIDAGLDLDKFKADRKDHLGQDTTDDEAQRYVNSWRLRRLAPIRDALSQEWRQRYNAWVADLGEPEHPEFVSYTSGGWVGPTSPKTAEELAAMGVEKIVDYLRTWGPSGDIVTPSPEGLGRTLTTVVTSAPERFAADAGRFIGLDPTYVRALLQGFHDATKQNRAFAWPQIMELCHWVIEQPRENPGRERKNTDADPDGGWTHKAVADLLRAGFEEHPAMIPYELHAHAWAILKPLTDDPDPTPEHEERYGGSNMDAATLSINTTRGSAMHAVIRYALWIRRHLEKQPEAKPRIARGFEEMPEVREILDAHLDPAWDPALAIRAVYGWWFPWLVLLDTEWSRSRLSKIYPREEVLQHLRDAAWNAYIIFCAAYDNVFDVLRDEYGQALDRVGAVHSERLRGDPHQRLAEHLMVYYWRGKLSLDEPDGLLALFYRRAPDSLKAHALEFLGRVLRDTQEHISEEILDRLRLLWERRLVAVREATPSVVGSSELVAFDWWFASRRFEDSWAITQLIEALKLARRAEPDDLVAERLAMLATTFPRETVECLRLMIEGDQEGWHIHIWREHARTILTKALQATNIGAQQAAVDLIHQLGSRGYFEFRDLLPTASKS